MTTGWINKLPNLPPPYNPRRLAILPAADVGINLRGAFPIGWYRCKDCIGIPFVLGWDLWVGNGPDEHDCDIRFSCNYDDNNYNIATGGRLGFRFFPYREIGVSWMWAQWNNNRCDGRE